MKKFRNIEIDLFIQALYEGFGYDFREYNKNHIIRRIEKFVETESIASISILQHRMFYETNFFERMIRFFSVNVTSFFRDETFYKSFQSDVVPLLKSFPEIKIWHAGCSTGEEVYSMAILLDEAGLLNRCQLYGTDFNKEVLEKGKFGRYSKEVIEEFETNYVAFGGRKSIVTYFDEVEEAYQIKPYLRERVSFHQHNLTTDHILGEMHVVICRNVMIYFSRPLQEKVFNLLDQSIKPGGLLCLGAQETIHQSSIEIHYKKKNNTSKIFMKDYVRGN